MMVGCYCAYISASTSCMYALGLLRRLPLHDKAHVMLSNLAYKKHFGSVVG